MKNDPSTKLWNRVFIQTMAVFLLSCTTVYIVSPILSKYAVNRGISLTLAGTLVGLFSTMAMVIRPFSGALGDRNNKKWLLIISIALIGFPALGYIFVDSMPVLYVFRILQGIGFGISTTVNNAIGYLYIPEDRMGEGIGYLGLCSIIATALGPNIGLTLLEHFGFTVCFFTAFAFSLLAIVVALFLPSAPPTQREHKNLNLKFSDFIAPSLIPLTLLVGLYALCNGLTSAFLPLLGDERGISNVGLFFTICVVVMMFVRPAVGKLSDRVSLKVLLYPAFLCSAIAMLLLAVSRSLWWVVLAAVFKGLGQGTGQPAIQAECIRQLGKERSGVATSTYYIGCDLAQGIGPAIGGAICSVVGYGGMFLWSSLMMLLGDVGFFFYTIWYKKKSQ